MKVVVTSHGDLCEGIVNSLQMIVGENKNVYQVSLTESGIGEFTEKFRSLLDQLIEDEQVLVLCDLKGGTPYNVSFQYHLEHPERTMVMSGVNLPMLIETTLSMEAVTNLAELAEIAVQSGKNGVEVTVIEENDDDDSLF